MSTSEQPRAFRQRIETLVDLRRFEEAVKAALDWLAAAPNLADAHAYLSWALLKNGKWDEADREAREALGLAADWHWPHRLLACAHYNRRRYHEALALMLDALRIAPDNADYHQFHSRILLALERRDEALTSARRAVELEPQSAEFQRWLLAVQYLDKSADSSAINHLLKLQSALALDPNNGEILDDLATIYHEQLGDYARAEEFALQALAAKPENREYLAHVEELRPLKDPCYRWLRITWECRHIPTYALADMWSDGFLAGVFLVVCFVLPCVASLLAALVLFSLPGGAYMAMCAAPRWSLKVGRPWLARLLWRVGNWPVWLRRVVCVLLAAVWWGLLAWLLPIEPEFFAGLVVAAVIVSIAFTLFAYRKQRRRAALLKTLIVAETADDIVRAELV
jgi:tetratricopeptide (TPR) repeat protein